MARWPSKPAEPEVAGIPEPEVKADVIADAVPEVKTEISNPEIKNSGEYWRSLTDEQKKTYIGLYSNPYVRTNFPDVVELAWSEYVKRPKGETK